MPNIALLYLGQKGSGGPISLALGQALAARGARVNAYLSSSLESLPAWQSADVGITTVPTFRNSLQAGWSLLTNTGPRQLAAQIKTIQPDALVFPMQHPWNARLQRLLHPIPSVVFVHEPRAHPGLRGWIQARWEDYSIHAATHCLVLSRSLAPELELRGVPANRISVISHGMLPYAPVVPENSPYSAPHLLFFGRIEPYKGLEVLLESYEQLQNRWPGIRLTIAGEGNMRPYRDRLSRLYNVELVSRWILEPEIPQLFSRATLLVLPYTSASQSGVLAIAAGFALPVVTTRTGGVAEQVSDGETGLLVEPGSASALTAGIERLLADPSLSRRMGAALRQDFLSRQNWDPAAQSVIRLVRGV
jgi:glycosyltransferase involved in cell wall biosynthesis